MVELAAFCEGAGGEADDGHYPDEHADGDACSKSSGVSLIVWKDWLGHLKEGGVYL